MSPISFVGRHHVGVSAERERRSFTGSRDAGDEVGALGLARDQLAFDTRGLEIVPKELGGLGFVPRGIRGIDADQSAQKIGRLGPNGRVV
ncbi:MAG: hypothetical protein ACRDKF_08530 [Actinomycetota bacterium]